MKTLRYTINYVHHIVDTKTERSFCGRPAHDWHGFSLSFGNRIDWSNNEYPKRCKQCGNIEDFQIITDQMAVDYEDDKLRCKEAQEKASSLARQKQEILNNQVWPQVKYALEGAGFNVREEEPKAGQH